MSRPNWLHKAGHAPHHQGQVYDETTGATVAVTYDDEGGQRAAMMAAAPDMLAALERVYRTLCNPAHVQEFMREPLAEVRDAIETARGGGA